MERLIYVRNMDGTFKKEELNKKYNGSQYLLLENKKKMKINIRQLKIEYDFRNAIACLL